MTEVERICLAALERPAEERAAFLEAECHGDEVLRRDIESLLAHASPAEQFMEQPAVAGAGALAGLSGLSLGQRLGPYHIVARLGAGGMGEVYRAHDTQLGREVAIKILPVVFAADPERLARFEREARILASLNHPHIAAIYGVETDTSDDDVPRRALVMELIEGPTLAERILRGPLSMAEALPVARQIAEALEAAHEQGIVHRDLKPANVKVRPDGTVKVLDFGLAKETEPAGAAVNAKVSPTITTPPMTQAGVILGTAAYMSPEQCRGDAVDKRTDIWAFGCVMYEMLAGRQAFPSGETFADTLAGVLTREPDWDALPAATPAAVRSLIRRCLRKDARRRLPDIAEARIELEDAAGEPAPASQSTTAPTSRHKWLWAAVAIASLITAAAFGAWITSVPRPDARVYRFEVYPPAGATFMGNPGGTAPQGGTAMGQPLSPDGRMLAFVAVESGRQQIWVKRLDSAAAPRPLPGTETARRPAWSPDSRFLAFIAGGQLKTVRVDGGPSKFICDAQGRREVAWGVGVILLGGRGPLLRVAEGGGQAVPATELDPDETTHDYPDFFPGGRRFLYMARRGRTTSDRWDVYVGSLDSAERHILPGVHSAARISPTGHILFLRDGTLMAQPMDLDTLAPTEEAFPLAEGAYMGANPPFSASTNGSLAYLGQSTIGESHLVWTDRDGKQTVETGSAGQYRNLDLSPDGKFAAFDRRSLPVRDVFWLNLERGSLEKLTTAGADEMPVWSPDSQSIVYLSSREPAGGIAARGNSAFGDLYARGVGVVDVQETVVRKDTDGKTPTDWSESGYLAYISGGDIWALLDPLSGNSKPIQVTNTRSRESDAKISPNGRWIAYQSDDSASEGQQEVSVQSFPRPGFKQNVSTRGGAVPRWSPDGRKLFYLAPDLWLMSVSIDESAQATPRLGQPTRLFRTPLRSAQGRDYDVDRGGRFLFNVPSAEPPAVPITVILNWPEILAARRTGS